MSGKEEKKKKQKKRVKEIVIKNFTMNGTTSSSSSAIDRKQRFKNLFRNMSPPSPPSPPPPPPLALNSRNYYFAPLAPLLVGNEEQLRTAIDKNPIDGGATRVIVRMSPLGNVFMHPLNECAVVGYLDFKLQNVDREHAQLLIVSFENVERCIHYILSGMRLDAFFF